MDIISFLLGIVGDVAKSWIIEFIRGEKTKNISEQQTKLIKEYIDLKLEMRSNLPNISSDIMANEVVEQIIEISKNPDFPIIITNGIATLREAPSGKPFFWEGKKEKWEDKEISTRLYKLDNAIKERYSEIGEGKVNIESNQNDQEIMIKSKLPPINKPNELEKIDDWRRRIEKTVNLIEERRQQEIKPSIIKKGKINDNDN